MGNKTKAFKKFASSGKLKDTIKARRSHQQKRRKADEQIAQRKKQRGAPKSEGLSDGEEEDEDDERDVNATKGARGGKAGGVAKTVEELFGEGGLDVSDEEESDLDELDEEDDSEEAGEDEEDEEDDEGLLDEEVMKKTMKGLAKSDPEFFKYLQENDRELLEFGKEPAGAKSSKAKGKGKTVDDDEEMQSGEEDEDEEDVEDEEDEDEEDDDVQKISVTMRMVREWQNGMLKVGLTTQ